MTNTTQPAHIGHRARIRERARNIGTEAFLDHEFLELLLTYAIPRKDTKPIAWALLKRFGSFSQVLDANESSLLSVPGVGPSTVQLLQLVRNSFTRYTHAKLPKQISLSSIQKVLNYCQASLAGKQTEFVEVMFLSARCTLLATRRLAEGSITQVTIEPRQVLEKALQEKATSLIIIHNHPSGNSSPSAEDIKWTQQLEKAAELFNIRLWDHIIISKNSYFSFFANQLLGKKDKPADKITL